MLIALMTGCSSVMFKTTRVGQYRYITRNSFAQTPVKYIPIWVDDNFGEADRLSIDDAVNKWNYSLNNYIKLEVVDYHFKMEPDKVKKRLETNGWIFMRTIHTDKSIPKTENGYKIIGFCNVIGGNYIYIVRDSIGNKDVMGVMLHEIGHLLGANHVDEDLMYNHYTESGYQCIDYKAIDEVAKYQHLPIDNLNYCINGIY